MIRYCFGADVGGTTVKLGLFDVEGTVLDKWEIPTHIENGGSKILPEVAASILAKIEEKGLKKEEVAGVGVGVPGPVDTEGVIPHTANLNWGRKEVARELSEATGLFCKVGNDANVAALGEMWQGGAKGHKGVLMITLGTGVGGGIVVDGKILSGAHGAGGEIGHLHVNDDEEECCGCGNKGCLEQYGSATGIVRIAKQVLAETEEATVLRDSEVTAKAVFDAVKAGDPAAKEVAERVGKYLGTACAVMTAVLDPEVIVFGGGVSRAGETLLEYVRKNYKPRAYKATRETEFALASLGNDAGIYGCAKLVLG